MLIVICLDLGKIKSTEKSVKDVCEPDFPFQER